MEFKSPATILISGPSQSGKSTLVLKMIKEPSCFDRPPTNVIIAYSRMQALYRDIMDCSPVPVRLVQGLSQDLKTTAGTLLVIDDLQNEAGKAVCDWFTKNAHHYETNVVYLVQNLFLKSPEHRTASINAHYIILFKNPRDKSIIIHLAKQFAPNNPGYIVDAFKQATARAHGYLMLDFKQETNDLFRIRDSVFANPHIFVDRKTGSPVDLASIGLTPTGHAPTWRI